MSVRSLVTALLVATAAATGGCDLGDHAGHAITVTPPGPPRIAMGGSVTLRLHRDSEAIGTVEAVSSDPGVLEVVSIEQAPDSNDASVTVRALGTGSTVLTFSSERWSERITIESGQPLQIEYLLLEGARGDQVRPIENLIRVDARASLTLGTWLGGQDGRSGFIGQGVITVPPAAEFAVVSDPLYPNIDAIRLGPAAPGSYDIVPSINGFADYSFKYAAVTEGAVVDARLLLDDENHQPAPGARVCTILVPLALGNERIYGAQATWTIDGVAQATLGDHLCFDYGPELPSHEVTVDYAGIQLTRVVHGARLVVLAPGVLPPP